jgi:hypothetical protein
MDKDERVTEEELEKMLEKGFDFDDVVGQRISFNVLGMVNENGRWDIKADATFALSKNGADWATSEIPVSTSDDDYDSALATVMLGVVNALNNPMMLARMRKSLDSHIVPLTKGKVQ